MTVPNPSAIDRQVKDLDRELRKLLSAALRLHDPYRWAYYAALQTSVRGDDKETGGRSKPVHELNPTLGVVSDSAKRAQRSACHAASRHLVDASRSAVEYTSVLNGIRDRLVLSFGDNEITGSETGVLLPRTATQVELRDAEDKVRERRAAGEGYGET